MDINWVKTKAVFASEYDDLGIEQQIEERLAPFRFNIKKMVAYNESSTDGYSTIWINGMTITIEMSVKEIDEYIEFTEKL